MIGMRRFDGIGDPELRRTLLYVRSEGRPVTAAAAAAALGVPRTAARHRLERLVAAGLLEAKFARQNGRTGPGAGRPAKTYAAAVELAQLEFPPRRYERLVELAIGALPRRGRPGRLAEIGMAFGSELAEAAGLRSARSPATAVERLCRGLGALGFHASVVSVEDREAVLETATCPLRPIVVTYPESRAVDQAMWSGLVSAVLPGAASACETGSCLEAGSPCRVRITFRD
jgi:predicted ArsR family transcriptional regulator